MAQPRRTSLAPWITAAVAGVVLIALILIFFLWLRPDEKDADRERAAAAHSLGGLSATEVQAMNAAATEMVNLVTFSREHFDTDFQRALAGTTGALRHDVQDKRAKTLQAITAGKFDLFGKVSHKALADTVSNNDQHGYVVLVSINGYRSNNPTLPIPQNLAVTVINVNGKWLAADVTYIGISA
jgi:hypothetical protein